MKHNCAKCGRLFNGTALNLICYGCRVAADQQNAAIVPPPAAAYKPVELERQEYGNALYTQQAYVWTDVATCNDAPAPSDFTGGGGTSDGGGASGNW